MVWVLTIDGCSLQMGGPYAYCKPFPNRELYVLSLSDFKHSCLNLDWSLSDNEFLSKLSTIFGDWVKIIADRLFLATISDISLDHVDNRGLHWGKH